MKKAMFEYLKKFTSGDDEADKIDSQLDFAKKRMSYLFSLSNAMTSLTNKSPAEWWEKFGDEVPELQRFAIRVLSLTCSSSECERSWSAFEMIQTKKRNRLRLQRLNDLVYVMYNLKLKNHKQRLPKNEDIENLNDDDEWLADDEYEAEVDDEDVDCNLTAGNTLVDEGQGGSNEDLVIHDLDDDGEDETLPPDDLYTDSRDATFLETDDTLLRFTEN